MIPKALIPPVLALAAVAQAADFPTAEIANGQIRAKLYLPDAKNGYYRATRFDWSGFVYSLEYKGHNYYGPWYQKIDPNVYDFSYEGSDVISHPCTAGLGPLEEYQTNGRALGWDDAKPGGTFVKVGVGVLRRPDEANYDHSKLYEIVDPGKWSVKKSPDSVEFTQAVSDPASQYGYLYRKTLRLIKGKPQMLIEHSLKNTGTRPIQTSMYNHNFLVLDKLPPGPDFTITVPFQIQARRAPNKDLAAIRGNQIVYLKTLADRDRATASIQGFGDSPKDYDIRVENRGAGAGVRITGDHPLTNASLWSIRTVLAIEPFIAISVDPGSEFTWNITYDYYTLPADAK
ncbi:MAG: hypothetical protein LAQ69_24955 [Acidobacteriia bacterium]|nr:hypothetical protein [Terriglobia bacterium]